MSMEILHSEGVYVMLCYIIHYKFVIYTQKNNNKKLFLISGKNIKNEGKRGK